MIILTGANVDKAKTDFGQVYKNFSYRGVIQKTVDKAVELGIGTPFTIEDSSFSKKGHYEEEVIKGYKSESLFKPEMVKICMEEHNELTIYLDGDAQLCGSLDEVEGDDYDIGVTLRDSHELESEWRQQHLEIVKYVNAGVIFFNATPATKSFI